MTRKSKIIIGITLFIVFVITCEYFDRKEQRDGAAKLEEYMHHK